MGNVCRTLTTSILAALLAAGMFSFADADARSISYDLNIPSEDLTAALQSFAIASHHKLLYKAELTAGKTSRALKGHFTAQEAMEALLSGTGLSYEITGSSVVLIKNQTGTKTGDLREEGISPSSDSAIQSSGGQSILLAQANPPTRASGDSTTNDNQIVPKKGPKSSSSSEEEKSGLSEIVVTGTHIRGVNQIASPVMTFTSEDIARSGYSTLAELFESLPQNVNIISQAGQIATGGSSLANANTQGASGISLRGLGPGATLVLLNGVRLPGNVYGRVIDISAFPLSAIDRIEILTGGTSAIYGSDAVAGVVNLITKRGMDGAETQANYDAAAHGADFSHVTQAWGKESSSAGIMATYDYSRQLPYDVADTNVRRLPSALGVDLDHYDVIPYFRRQTGMLSGHFAPSDTIDLYADTFYTHNDNMYETAYSIPSVLSITGTDFNETTQYNLDAGAHVKLGDAWRLSISASRGVFSSHEGAVSNSSPPNENSVKTSITSGSAVADGSFDLGPLQPRAALGVDDRKETFFRQNPTFAAAAADEQRTVKSAFSEIIVPIGSVLGPNKVVDLSIAGRYEDYSDFGSTFNWQGGAVWWPFRSLKLRGDYSTAFRAPDLYTITAGNSAGLAIWQDPASPTGKSTVLQWQGGNPDLKPERARTWSVGFDFKQESGPITISGSYYHIYYSGQIQQPATGNVTAALTQSYLYPGLINRSPSPESLSSIVNSALNGYGFSNTTGIPFNPRTQMISSLFPTVVVFDNRQTNVAVQNVQGIDLQAHGEFDIDAGKAILGINGTYYLKFDRSLTPTSSVFSQLSQAGQPLRYRLRGTAGLTRSIIGAYAYVNYAPSYTDTADTPNRDIASWTTVDVTLRMNFGELPSSGLLKNLTLSVDAQNLFDRNPPPFFGNLFGLGYDPVNANALGRVIGISAIKRW